LPQIDGEINEVARCTIYSTHDLKSDYCQIMLAKRDRELKAFKANGKLY